MVDALGGVTVTNPTAIVNCPYEAGRTVSFPAGRIQLNGPQALEFSRVRKCDTDFNRALRQQAVVAGMKSKVLSLGRLWRAPWRGAAGRCATLQTDIGTMDMVKMGWLQARLKQTKGDRILLTGEPQLIGGISFVVQTNPDLNERQIASFVVLGIDGTPFAVGLDLVEPHGLLGARRGGLGLRRRAGPLRSRRRSRSSRSRSLAGIGP